MRRYRVASTNSRGHTWYSEEFTKLEHAQNARKAALKVFPNGFRGFLMRVQFYHKDHGWLLVAGTEMFL